MAAKLLTGKEVAQKMDQDIQKDVQELKTKGSKSRAQDHDRGRCLRFGILR